jgi:hypothetical protein
VSDLWPGPDPRRDAVSRFVEIALGLGSLDEVTAALARLGVAFERAEDPVTLHGGVECGDVPVDVRVAAGACDSVEDFGFVADDAGLANLVCGEPDRARLERTLVTPLRAELARARLVADGTLAVELLEARADGTVRLRVRPR